jgi:hypothetical protein
MNRVFKIIYPVLAVFLTFLIACSSIPETPDCVNSTALNAELSWGTIVKGDVNTAYKMKMNGEIFDLMNKEAGRLDVANPDTLCNLLRQLGVLIIEVQILNVPADTNLFVEYKNTARDYYFRALWDPKFDNVGNHSFAELYDRLVNLTKKK